MPFVIRMAQVQYNNFDMWLTVHKKNTLIITNQIKLMSAQELFD